LGLATPAITATTATTAIAAMIPITRVAVFDFDFATLGTGVVSTTESLEPRSIAGAAVEEYTGVDFVPGVVVCEELEPSINGRDPQTEHC